MRKEYGTVNGKNIERVTITTARKTFSNGKTVYLLPLLMRVNNMWQSPCSIDNKDLENDTLYKTSDELFESYVNSFEYYNCNSEMGNKAKFFVEV